ncbi:ATP phosphoribosyltransferase [Staphylospora marina]|uniref:ATP phosphoribosyltransferase n=1 Tax=Staphylospora marina TaxID=2490858 RepID=UPI000F5BCF76|nr:ATP phosphoribosyltransferase [Staphylospora marina]
MKKLIVAMPKGRLMEETFGLFRAAGLPVPAPDDLSSRRLTVPSPGGEAEFLLVKPSDVSVYVEYGAADLGVAGKDVLLEESRDVYELLDLGVGRCRLSVAGRPGWVPGLRSRVATKYPSVARRYFRERGEQVEVITLSGSVELAPAAGLADRIVDIVSTGTTLRENGLTELEIIREITARLIANRASYRMKSREIGHWVDRLAETVREEVPR